MPNNTYTEVRIQGSPYIIDSMYGTLQKIADPDKNEGFGFLETFVGDPTAGLTDEEKDTGVVTEGFPVPVKRWYSDRLTHWGTKWDIYNVAIDSIDFVPTHGGFEASRILKCTWHTAWSPCIEAMIHMSKNLNVDIHAKYIDECLNYVGQCTIINGKVNNITNYESDDVYEGLYRVFGPEHLLDYAECIEPDFIEGHILKHAKKFADKKTLKQLKDIIKSVKTD